jgi:hypothetical protein
MATLPTVEARAVWRERRRSGLGDANRASPCPATTPSCRRGRGFLPRPRVRDEHLVACYPDHYPRHQELSPWMPFKGSAGRRRAARWALATGLGYGAFATRASRS